MAVYVDSPPARTGDAERDLDNLIDYLYKCAEKQQVNAQILETLEAAATSTTTS